MDRAGERGNGVTGPQEFIAAHGWSEAQQTPLAGDASSRRYIRLCSGGNSAILMIDPQDDTERFATIATHLRDNGLSAPAILAHEPGLMLLEDFGDAQIARVIADEPANELPLYRAAADVLLHLQDCPLPSGLDHATPNTLGQMIAPVFTHYLPLMGQTATRDSDDLVHRLTDLLQTHLDPRPVLVLRDYHAENMIWLPDRDGARRIGLLDFQDALVGPRCYDLVSMLQDARRDVTDQCVEATFAHFLEASGDASERVTPAYHLLGLQRNLRILGIFARLATELGKPHYLSLLPRVWSHIDRSLTDPVAAALAEPIHTLIPPPTDIALERPPS